jgi:hypothetical protein
MEGCFVTAWHSSAVKSPLLCTVFTSDVQQTLNNQATVMKCRPDIHKRTSFGAIKVLLVRKYPTEDSALKYVHSCAL